MDSENQRKYNYSKKLLENLNIVLNHLRTNRQDLLKATKTLLQSSEQFLEPNRLLERNYSSLKEENSILEQSRDRVEQENIRLNELYLKELLRNENLEQINRKILEILKKFQMKLSSMPSTDGSIGQDEEKQFKFLNDLLNSALKHDLVTITEDNIRSDAVDNDTTVGGDENHNSTPQQQQQQQRQRLSLSFGRKTIEEDETQSSEQNPLCTKFSDHHHHHHLDKDYVDGCCQGLLSSSDSKPKVSSVSGGGGDGETDGDNININIKVFAEEKEKRSSANLNRQQQQQRLSPPPPRMHTFKSVKNMIDFFKCNACDKSIMPFESYVECLDCRRRLHKRCQASGKFLPFCHSSIDGKDDGMPEHADSQMMIKLDQNSYDLFKECLKQIQTRGIDKRRLYSIIEKNDRKIRDKVDKILRKYFMNNRQQEKTNLDLLKKLEKTDINVICALVATLLDRFEDSLVPSRLWNDFARACDQGSADDKINLIRRLIYSQFDPMQQNVLALFMQHLNLLITRNHCNRLDKKTAVNIFSRLLIRKFPLGTKSGPSAAVLNKKYEQIKICSIQKQILRTLICVDKQLWENMLTGKRKTTSTSSRTNSMILESAARRRTCDINDIALSFYRQSRRTSFVEKIRHSVI